MKSKQTLIYLIIAIALIAGVLVLENPFKSKTEDSLDKSTKLMKVEVFKKATQEKTHKLFIQGKDGATTVTLYKVKGEWYVNEKGTAKADSMKMQSLWEAAKKVTEGEVVSENAENFIKFNVQDGSPRVKFYDEGGKILEDIIIGKMSADFQSTFVRKPDSKKVLIIPAQLAYAFGNVGSVNDWRNKMVLKLNWQNVNSARIKGPKDTTRIEKLSNGDWEIMEPARKPASKPLAEGIARGLSYLNAAGFEDNEKQKPLKDFGLDPAEWTITVTVNDGSTTPTVKIGAKKPEGEYYAQVEGDPQIYLLREYNIKSLCRNSEELVPTPTPPPTPPASAENKDAKTGSIGKDDKTPKDVKELLKNEELMKQLKMDAPKIEGGKKPEVKKEAGKNPELKKEEKKK